MQPGNLNANRAIVTAAVMYVFRCLIDEDIPLNQGVLAPLQIQLPTCLLNPPTYDDPHDNVPPWRVATWKRRNEWSMCCSGALGVAAASQGTMNNLLFGDETFGYYETICGGSGATATRRRCLRRADAHDQYAADRPGSAGVAVSGPRAAFCHAAWFRRAWSGTSGGDGVIRQMEFLKPLQVSHADTAARRVRCPMGCREANQVPRGVTCCAQRRTRRTARVARQFRVEPGDVLIIETPGGGGYGGSEA